MKTNKNPELKLSEYETWELKLALKLMELEEAEKLIKKQD